MQRAAPSHSQRPQRHSRLGCPPGAVTRQRAGRGTGHRRARDQHPAPHPLHVPDDTPRSHRRSRETQTGQEHNDTLQSTHHHLLTRHFRCSLCARTNHIGNARLCLGTRGPVNAGRSPYRGRAIIRGPEGYYPQPTRQAQNSVNAGPKRPVQFPHPSELRATALVGSSSCPPDAVDQDPRQNPSKRIPPNGGDRMRFGLPT